MRRNVSLFLGARPEVRFTEFDLREWRQVIASAPDGAALARQQVRLASAQRLGAITAPTATDLRHRIAQRVAELRGAAA